MAKSFTALLLPLPLRRPQVSYATVQVHMAELFGVRLRFFCRPSQQDTLLFIAASWSSSSFASRRPHCVHSRSSRSRSELFYNSCLDGCTSHLDQSQTSVAACFSTPALRLMVSAPAAGFITTRKAKTTDAMPLRASQNSPVISFRRRMIATILKTPVASAQAAMKIAASRS